MTFITRGSSIRRTSSPPARALRPGLHDSSEVPFSFDRGDAWSVGWRTESIDVSALAAANVGKSVTLRFSAGDVGDSIYDTAVLIDGIRLVK
jgi:hypothetical protein